MTIAAVVFSLLPTNASADAIYATTTTLDQGSDPACAQFVHNEGEIKIVGNTVYAVAGRCVGQVSPDGTFACVVSGGKTQITIRVSGKISGATIDESFVSAFAVKKGRDYTSNKCSGTTHGVMEDAPPSR